MSTRIVRNMTRSWTVLLFSLASGAALAAQSYVPHRVYDTARGTFTDFEAMAAEAAASDLVFLGEQHDDPNTHRLELAVLEALNIRVRTKKKPKPVELHQPYR